MPQKKISIRKRAFLMSFIISIVVFIFMFIAAYKIVYHETEEILDQRLKSMAEWLADHNPVLTSSEFLPNATYNEEDVFVDIHLYTALSHDPLSEIVHLKQDRAGYYCYKKQNKKFIAYIVPLQDRQVQVSQPLAVREVLAFELAGTMLIPYLVILPIIFLLLYMGIYRALKPLQHLQQEFSQRQYHDLTPLSIDEYPIELNSIIDEVNALFTRIEKAQQEQNDFVSHAAHELRSPLTALNLQVSVLQKEHQDSRTIVQLKHGIRRLQHMVQQMLDLARQGETQLLNAEVFSIQQLLTEVVQELYPLADQKHIDIALVASDQAINLLADRHSFYLVFRNLIDNAIKYSPNAGTVEISVYWTNQNLEIWVEDSGGGIDESEYDQIIQKFYRIHNVDIGSGLGLAIVQKSLLRLNADIKFSRSQKLQGLLVIVKLPANVMV
ncbi:hypothetical protein CAP51_05525 [Acinetobacter populi]|uniref:histidine kinase n=2 Tax=Acinetobacter populi TaxID=1582270 RepID=A0A1Z9Z3K9_9GAMM|nr:hypothetical protein CAP51_05525 [Acinetobacter populi]